MIDNYSNLSKLSQFSKTLILQQFHSFVTMVDDQKILTGIKNTDVAYACTHQYLNPLDIVEKWWTIVDRVRRRPCSERRDIQLRIYQFTCRNNSTVHVDTVHKSSPSSDVNSVVEFCPSVSIPVAVQNCRLFLHETTAARFVRSIMCVYLGCYV